MALYNLWHPHLLAPRTLRAYLTEGDALYTGTGTDALIAAVCAAAGAGPAASWQWRAIRTQYFAAFRDDAESWEDAWPVAWQLTIELHEPPALAPTPVPGRFAVDEIDASYRHAAPPDHRALPCVVLAAFRDVAAADAAAAGAPGPVERGLAMDRYPSIAVELGRRDDDFFAGGALDAEAEVARLAAAGASVDAQATFGWSVERAS